MFSAEHGLSATTSALELRRGAATQAMRAQTMQARARARSLHTAAGLGRALAFRIMSSYICNQLQPYHRKQMRRCYPLSEPGA